MMPEILGVQVALYHFAQKPGSYKDFATHVQEVKMEQERGSKKKSHGTILLCVICIHKSNNKFSRDLIAPRDVHYISGCSL